MYLFQYHATAQFKLTCHQASIKERLSPRSERKWFARVGRVLAYTEVTRRSSEILKGTSNNSLGGSLRSWRYCSHKVKFCQRSGQNERRRLSRLRRSLSRLSRLRIYYFARQQDRKKNKNKKLAMQTSLVGVAQINFHP